MPPHPPRGADLVDPEDPAFGHIIQAARRLIQFGFDPSDPEIAQRAIKAGREDYETDPNTIAKRTMRDSAARHYGPDVLLAGEVVYYMRIGNRIKIGWSTNLPRRLASINPEELLATEPGGRVLEARRHAEFAHLRTHGEWFQMDEPLTSHIAKLAAS